MTQTMPRTKRTLTPANDYRTFLRALKKGKWTVEELEGEVQRPEKLQALIELMGEEKYEASMIRAFENGHVDKATGEVLWVEHKKKAPTVETNGEPKKVGTGSEVLPLPPPAPVTKTPTEIQTAVDEMVFHHGSNVLNRADRAEILAEYHLQGETITDRMIERADQRARDRLKETLAKRNDQTSNRVKVIWEGDEQLDPAINPDHSIRGVAAAKREVEERGKTAAKERLNGLHSRNGQNSDNGDGEGRIISEGDDSNTFTFEGENEMKMSEKAARTLLTSAGVEAKTWGAKKLMATLNDQERLVECNEPEDEKQKERFAAVLQAVADGKKITVTQAQATGTNGDGRSKKPGSEGKVKKAGPGRKKKDGSMSCVDAIYKVLSETKKEMTAEELVEAMAKKGYWSSPGATPVATVGARIYVEINKKGKESRFVKVGKGTFAAR